MVKDKLDLDRQTQPADEIAIDGFDHIEFYVSNALQACYYYHQGFGFDVVGYRGLETGHRESTSYVLKQGNVQIVLTSALKPGHIAAQHVYEHGDGVKAIGFRVRDARKAYETAIARGAKSFAEPVEHKGEDGTYVSASICTYGDTIHTFVERHNYKGGFAPGFRSLEKMAVKPVGLAAIDHAVGNCELGGMDRWADFYKRIFGFYVDRYFDAEDISTKYSALQSKVMMNKSTTIKMPLNEPAEGLRKSQIQEYLDYNLAEGVQHVAIATRDIVATVGALRKQGIDFLTVPKSYYDGLKERGIKTHENMDDLAELGILVDSETKGYLLQIFTKPIQDRPTFFFEVIQRVDGATGFGQGNFQALFEAIERDQAARGNL